MAELLRFVEKFKMAAVRHLGLTFNNAGPPQSLPTDRNCQTLCWSSL